MQRPAAFFQLLHVCSETCHWPSLDLPCPSIFPPWLCCSSITHYPETLTPHQDPGFCTSPASATWTWAPQVNPSGLRRPSCPVTWEHYSCCLNSAPFQLLSMRACVWQVLAQTLWHSLLQKACFACHPLFTIITSCSTLLWHSLHCYCVPVFLTHYMWVMLGADSGLGLIYLCTCGIY